MKPLEMNFSSEGDEQKETPSFSSFDNETQFISCTAVGSLPPPMMTMMTKPNKKKKMTKKTVRPMVFVPPASTTSDSTSTTDTLNTNHRSDDNIRRSQLYVEGICCTTEIPIVTDILYRSFPKQVQNVQINVTHRIVYVDHDESELSIQDISQKLSNEGFESQILNANTIVESSIRIPSLSSLQALEPFLVEQGWTDSDMLLTIEFDSRSKIVIIKHDIQKLSTQFMLQVIQESGFPDATLVTEGSVKSITTLETHRLQLNVILSGIFWVISMLNFIDEDWDWLKYAGILSVVFGLPPVTRKAFLTIRRKQFDANCMMVMAALGALALQEFDEAASVAFLFSISEFLERRASHRARQALQTILDLRPDTATIYDGNPNDKDVRDVKVIPARDVKIGHLISVKTGDKVATDGIVVEGNSSVDESSLTGEAFPKKKTVGDTICGGSINVGNGHLIIRSTSIMEESSISKLIRLVEEAQSNPSTTETLVDNFAKRYTPTVVVVALLFCTIPWFISKDLGRYWTLNGLIIIVVACPCALTISTPVTYAAALAALAQRGVIAKGGMYLERLGKVDHILFDKTGTLTKGKFILQDLIAAENDSDFSKNDILQILCLMEEPSGHPLASTLVTAIKERLDNHNYNYYVQNHTVLKGEGVTASLVKENSEPIDVYVGNHALFQRLGIYNSLSPKHKSLVKGWEEDYVSKRTIGFMSISNQIVAMFRVSDTLRPEANSVIRYLQSENINIVMLTGDGDSSALAVAKELKIPSNNVHTQLLPQDKLHFIGSMRSSGSGGSTVMVGDGMNDAPALAKADVGIAMGDGAALTLEMSHVTLMDNDLGKLVLCLKMGQRVLRTIRENIALAIIAKLAVVVATFFGKMTLFLAIAADVGVMLAVTLNGMKLLHISQSKKKQKKGFQAISSNVDTDPIFDLV